MTTTAGPSDNIVMLSTARSGLTAPPVCAGCGTESSLRTIVRSWTLNPVTAAVAVACAVVFPAMIVYGRAILVLLYQGDPGSNGEPMPSPLMIGIPVGLGAVVYGMAAWHFSVRHSLCSGCFARLQSPLRQLTPVGVWFVGAFAAFALVVGVGLIIVHDDPMSIPAGLGFLAVGALLLWLAARWLRWFLTSRPVFVDGDAYGVRLHAKSPVFLARLRDALPDAPAAADTDEGVAALDRAHPPYLPLAGAATALTVLLFAGVVAALAGLVSTSAQISLLLGDTIDKIPAAVVAASDQRDRLVGIMQLATFAAGGIAFLFWLHRARRNLASLGARGLAYSPGLAVAYWFIPLSNLCRPFDVMVETWKASGPSQPGTEAWRFAPLGSVLKSWWILFLVSNLLGTLTFTLSMNLGVFAGRPSPLTFGLLVVSWVRLASDLAAVASVALLIVIVQTISRRQDEARQRLVHIG